VKSLRVTRPSHHFAASRQLRRFRLILLKNLKMELKQKFATDPSRPVFGNRMPCSRATKRAGWKSAWTCGPSHNFSMTAPAPLKRWSSSQRADFFNRIG